MNRSSGRMSSGAGCGHRCFRNGAMGTLRMEHLERAHVAMLFLEQEMKGAISCKFKSFSTCKIIPGQTVK